MLRIVLTCKLRIVLSYNNMLVCFLYFFMEETLYLFFKWLVFYFSNYMIVYGLKYPKLSHMYKLFRSIKVHFLYVTIRSFSLIDVRSLIYIYA